ncbi:S8 family peptidase [Saccharomonospora piscinae]|uniref:S8 family peptidase n=1 Tax=Saccharomonospora piscinae TaxID=687388 RepID=UPI001FD92479|nr:S8 family peptidase [Saccharomonospora piscinae]
MGLRFRRSGRAVAVAALAAVTITVAGSGSAATVAAPGATAHPAGADAAAPGASVVTLVTGDRAILGAGPGAEFVPGPGRDDVGYRQYLDHGEVHVIPNDAAALIADGTLDRRLFNVTALVEAGYHDSARDEVPVLVSYRQGQAASAEARARTTADGAAVRTRSLAAIGGAALEADKAEASRFWDGVRPMLRPGAEIERLWLDAPVRASLAESVPQIGADEVHENGYTGEGVRVAVLDTGIDAEHPDLASAVVEAKDFTGGGSAHDGNGHGTHVAGTIAGDGAASDGRYRGVAPDAELVVGKVLADHGSGQESWILAGMEWAAGNAAVVNMSLGGDPSDGTDPMSVAVNRLTEETGALFVVAAGNAGPDTGTVGSPGSADAALTVGAVTKDDELAEFSSRGPRTGDGAIKPDVTAPGQDIVAARAAGPAIGEPVGEHYTTASGTSMAAPHVAGAAALLAESRTGWDADELKPVLMGSAQAHPALTVHEQGAGRIAAAAAMRRAVFASPASLNLGVVEWPHTDDEPVRRSLTYTNTAEEPITLDLAGELTGPDGNAPEGMFTVEPAQLTVPAGGQAEATVTVDTTVGGADGRYSGVVLATAGDTVVRTPVGVDQEVESYELDLTVLDRDGKPAPQAYVFLSRHGKPWTYGDYHESGEFSQRLAKDDYYLAVDVNDGYGLSGSTIFAEPTVSLDRDRTLVLDARDAEPLSVTLERADAELGLAEASFLMETDGGYPETGMLTGGTSLDDVFLRPSETTDETFEFTLDTEHARPDGAGGFGASPYAYHLRQTERGGVPAELTYSVADEELARVHSVHTGGGAGFAAARELVTGTVPFEVTDYYTPDVRWRTLLWLGRVGQPLGEFLLMHTEVFERGDNGQRRWNVPVFGPAFPQTDGFWAQRDGDNVRFDLPLYADSAPGSAGRSVGDSGFTELFRDGESLGRTEFAGFGEFAVPASAGEYRLRVEADRSSVTPLSRTLTSEWTFRSGHQDTAGAVPLLAVRYAPDLGDDHAATPGEPVRVPVTVQRNGLAGEPELASLRVEVSFDGGESWRFTPYRPNQAQRVLTVTAPEGTDDVSLRAVAEDTDGNTVEQTIVGAYPVR